MTTIAFLFMLVGTFIAAGLAVVVRFVAGPVIGILTYVVVIAFTTYGSMKILALGS